MYEFDSRVRYSETDAQGRMTWLALMDYFQDCSVFHSEAVNLGVDSYARMDFLLNENNEMFCLEANTLPGMTATSLLPQEAAVIGIKYEDLCERLIQISQEKYGGKHE